MIKTRNATLPKCHDKNNKSILGRLWSKILDRLVINKYIVLVTSKVFFISFYLFHRQHCSTNHFISLVKDNEFSMHWWFKSRRYVGITNSPLYFLIGCPDYWKRLQTSQYAVFSTRKSWQHAEEFCRSMDAYLAKIESRDEGVLVRSLLIDLNSTGWYWIGLSDIEVENNWKWSDGSSLGPHNPWASDSPGSPGADCVCILRYPWHFRSCLKRQKFICEKKDWGRLYSQSFVDNCGHEGCINVFKSQLIMVCISFAERVA